MNLLTLSLAYLRARSLNAALNVLLLGLGVGTIVVLLLFSRQLEQRLERDARGIDLVVGAKGSPLQLILSSVYHVDIPTGNIPCRTREAQAILCRRCWL
jgi:putative ABC transport system permease protein